MEKYKVGDILKVSGVCCKKTRRKSTAARMKNTHKITDFILVSYLSGVYHEHFSSLGEGTVLGGNSENKQFPTGCTVSFYIENASLLENKADTPFNEDETLPPI